MLRLDIGRAILELKQETAFSTFDERRISNNRKVFVYIKASIRDIKITGWGRECGVGFNSCLKL